ncbi:hypothetical protein NEHOM01_2241 [Nematocida homosporus]|uniref:uncharacterized protein n=1 Tax=Nematocida homosporus TaxID=1912981 RepID=UPI00221EE4BE|nr:uncharacterized protein NEHOM01_2241 [Nematocida homosporus]KAI5187522.1 hypothetical protein NEHOM01_2241 [Nematocida homosporus]
MNKRLNEYSLNVYQVVCLVIGLCCVWCSSDEDSVDMELFDMCNDATLARDSQIASEYAEITNAIYELNVLRKNQAARIYQIKVYQQGLMEQEQQLYTGLKSIQRNPSGLGKSKNPVGPKKVELISQLVREEVMRQTLNRILLQLNEWLDECKNAQIQEESRMESIVKLVNAVKRLNQIKDDPLDLQKQTPNSERSIFENNLITIGAQYHPIELKTRFAAFMVVELRKIRHKIDRSEWIHLTKIMESKIDQVLINDELKSRDNISRLIEEALVWLDGRSKEMEVERESKQKPTDPEPSTSRAQSSNPQTNKSGMDGKLYSSSESADQDSTLSFNGYGLKQPGLDQQGCILS